MMRVDDLKRELHSAADAQPKPDVDGGRASVHRIVRRHHQRRIGGSLVVVLVLLLAVGLVATRRSNTADFSTDPTRLPRFMPSIVPKGLQVSAVGSHKELFGGQEGLAEGTAHAWLFSAGSGDSIGTTSGVAVTAFRRTSPPNNEEVNGRLTPDDYRILPGGLRQTIRYDGLTSYSVTARGLTDDQLRAATTSVHLQPDGRSLAIDLPADQHQILAITPAAVDTAAYGVGRPVADEYDATFGTPAPSGSSLSTLPRTGSEIRRNPELDMSVTAEAGGVLPMLAFMAGAQRTNDVRGHEAYEATTEQPEFAMGTFSGGVDHNARGPVGASLHAIIWSEGGSVIAVYGQELSVGDLRAFAEGLQPVGEDEWSRWAQAAPGPGRYGPSSKSSDGPGVTGTSVCTVDKDGRSSVCKFGGQAQAIPEPTR